MLVGCLFIFYRRRSTDQKNDFIDEDYEFSLYLIVVRGVILIRIDNLAERLIIYAE
jgi:hypothetical protein